MFNLRSDNALAMVKQMLQPDFTKQLEQNISLYVTIISSLSSFELVNLKRFIKNKSEDDFCAYKYNHACTQPMQNYYKLETLIDSALQKRKDLEWQRYTTFQKTDVSTKELPLCPNDYEGLKLPLSLDDEEEMPQTCKAPQT